MTLFRSARGWLVLAMLCATIKKGAPAQSAPLVVGTLQSDPQKAQQLREAGASVATVEIAWDGFEPQQGQYNAVYLNQLKAKIAAFRSAGQQIVLDLGMQYPPADVLQLPDARYVNQFGVAFVEQAPGKNIPNAVFNQAVRARQAAYVARVFADLGNNFRAVRLGWGWYNELNYPPNTWNTQTNCYWGFDALAQGRKVGLPVGVAPCPVAGWKPGDASPSHQKAALFANWYMNSLKNYHDWQITTVRRSFAGELSMLYPGWGIRPDQLNAAVALDLNAETQHINGELGQGVEFERMVNGISDPKVTLHTTWIDSNENYSDEYSFDRSRWSPAHFLSSLGASHRPLLAVSGENTGNGDTIALALSFKRARQYGFTSLLWAFESQLFDGQHAPLSELKNKFKPPKVLF